MEFGTVDLQTGIMNVSISGTTTISIRETYRILSSFVVVFNSSFFNVNFALESACKLKVLSSALKASLFASNVLARVFFSERRSSYLAA